MKPSVLIALVALLIAVPAAQAKPRVTVSGDAAVLSTLTAATSGGRAQSITWERCPVKRATCPAGQGFRVGSGRTYGLQPEDIDAYVRAVVQVKPRRGAARTIRSAWKGPVKPAPTPAGEAKGMQVGEYTCYSGTLLSTIWIDSGTAYRSPSGTGGTYVLDPASPVYSTGAVKINWTSGPYAEWQTTDNFWSEYIPVGTPSVIDGRPLEKPKILMTFKPEQNLNWASSGWTTCDPK